MKRSHQHIGRLFSPLLIQKLNNAGVQVSLPGQNTAISSDSPAIHVTDWSFFVDVCAFFVIVCYSLNNKKMILHIFNDF